LKYLRRYSAGPLYAHATGFYSLVYGSTGVEQARDSILAGTDDRLFVRRVIDLITGEQPKGGSVELTLDAQAQRAAYQGLGDRKGAVVAIEPSTGAILAMVSRPSYNPAALSSHDRDSIVQSWKSLNSHAGKPMFNRALNGLYPPGSTFKIVTSAAALSSGKFNTESELPGPAELDLPLTTATLPNYDGQACGPGNVTTLREALRISCNTAFGALGMKLGGQALRDQAERFGFNSDINVPNQAATSVFPQQVDKPQQAQSAIGQYNVAASPLQMAMVAAGVGNNGTVMEPYLVQEVQGPDLAPLDTADPEPLSEAVSPQVAAQLTDMMVTVVEEGTGPNAAIPGVTVAGKTGTAQHGSSSDPHAWFVSFAPAEDPKVAVAVIIEGGADTASEISGNELAAPIARDVMEAVLGW
ncbi:MAG: peptidoglycan D,D-transpeptidase FtsI family protein, partial [Streptomycetales bacterium]